MLDKLQKIVEFIKKSLLYIIAPIGAIIGYLLYLRYKVTDLTDQLSQTQAEQELAAKMQEKAEAEKAATASETDYETLSKQYLKENPNDAK